MAPLEHGTLERGLLTRTEPLSRGCSAGPAPCVLPGTGIPTHCEEFSDRLSKGCQLPIGKGAWCHGGSVPRVSLSYGARHLPCPWRGGSSSVHCHFPKMGRLKDARGEAEISFCKRLPHLCVCLTCSARGQPRSSKLLPKEPFTYRGGWANMNKKSINEELKELKPP